MVARGDQTIQTPAVLNSPIHRPLSPPALCVRCDSSPTLQYTSPAVKNENETSERLPSDRATDRRRRGGHRQPLGLSDSSGRLLHPFSPARRQLQAMGQTASTEAGGEKEAPRHSQTQVHAAGGASVAAHQGYVDVGAQATESGAPRATQELRVGENARHHSDRSYYYGASGGSQWTYGPRAGGGGGARGPDVAVAHAPFRCIPHGAACAPRTAEAPLGPEAAENGRPRPGYVGAPLICEQGSSDDIGPSQTTAARARRPSRAQPEPAARASGSAIGVRRGTAGQSGRGCRVRMPRTGDRIVFSLPETTVRAHRRARKRQQKRRERPDRSRLACPPRPPRVAMKRLWMDLVRLLGGTPGTWLHPPVLLTSRR